MVNKPRIYIAISSFHPMVGGAEKQALMQGRSLRERGYTATILTFRHKKHWLSQEMVEGVPVIRTGGMLLGGREKLPKVPQKLLYLLAMVVLGWRLWRERQHYDVLHVYQLNLLALLAALACWLAGKPLIVAVRCADSGTKAKGLNKASLVAGPLDATAPWLHVSGEIHGESDLEGLERMGKPIVRLTHSLLKRISATVVILSSRMRDDLAAHNFSLPNTQLIPNGVDIQRFHPDHAGTAGDKRPQVVICVARLRYQKGIDVLLQAWHLVQQQLPQPAQARLLIVGSGPLQTQYEYIARLLGIMDSVEFAGEQGDIAARLQQSVIAVLPSRFEGMSNAILEAMACGLPCVATRISGSEDIIQDGVNGLLVESEDYLGLAQALLILLRDPQLAQTYGGAARATIEQRYSLEHIMDMYVELYIKLVNDRFGMGSATRQRSRKPGRSKPYHYMK